MSEQHKQGLGINDLLDDKREEILKLAAKYGAYNVRIFGSVARGEATPESDIDFLVDFEQGATMFDLVGLWNDLRDLLGRNVDVVTEKSLKERLRRYVMKDVRSL